MTTNLARLAAGTLLLMERKARRELAEAVAQGADEATVALLRRKDEELTQAVIIALLLSISDRMEVRAAAAIRASRERARKAAARRAAIELRQAGVEVPMHLLLGTLTAAQQDELLARSAAASLANQWRAQAVHVAIKAERSGEDVASAVDRVRATMKHRVDRTAATETARAYNDEHRAIAEAIVEASQRDKDLFSDLDGDHLVREWSAILDARTCATCAALDGERTPVGEPFPSGEEPGFVHPLCRCISIIVALPASDQEAA